MNTVLNILKTLFVVIITFVVIFASYFFIVLNGDDTRLSFRGISEGQVLSLQGKLTDAELELSEYLNELKDVKLDVNFYLSTTSSVSIAFDNLESFKKGTPKLKSGRVNPFEPIN